MLYTGLIKYILQTQSAILENDLEKANNCCIKAQNIIRYFQSTLDIKYELSTQLSLLYDFMHQRLIDANISKDNGILTEVLDLARDLRDTWGQAMKIAKKNLGNRFQAAGG